LKGTVEKSFEKDEAGEILEQARRVIRIEAEAVLGLLDRLDRSFVDAVELIYNCRGRVIVSGVGKSGIISRKLAATLTSTGTPAIFIHPVDCMHGDLGLVTREDVFIAVSKSGETSEMERLLHLFKRLDVKVIAVTGAQDSSLARTADVVLDVGVPQEACPHDLAPTASTTAALVMGDALAIALLVRRDFRPEDFAALHPGGALGKRLLLKVGEVMVPLEDTGVLSEEATMKEALLELVGKRGLCSIVDREGRLTGVVTDGDFKRLFNRTVDFSNIGVREVMTANPKCVTPEELCVVVVGKMEKYSIISLPVVDGQRRVIGSVHLHDLMRARVI
jgi:arabinose-5-phosphate isomerase